MTIHQNIVVQQDQQPIGLVSVFVITGFVALIVTHFWAILVIVCVICAALLLAKAVTLQQMQREALAARADQQVALYLSGDPRAIYGDFDEGSQQR